MLGVAVEVWGDDGKKLLNTMGELVVTQPLPSMPVYLWDDPDFKKYKQSYFSKYGNVWNHGDWVTETLNSGIIVHGRSDATLNRFGVRIGSSEIYKAVNAMTEVIDSLIIHIKDENTDELILFIQVEKNITPEKIKLLINRVNSDIIETEVIIGGRISDNKGVNIPKSFIKLSPLTKKDYKGLDLCLDLSLDYVALSFVQKSKDIQKLKKIIPIDILITKSVRKEKIFIFFIIKFVVLLKIFLTLEE